MSHYKVSDEDVDGMIRYMEAFHPDKTSREYCRNFLEFIQQSVKNGVQDIALNNPEQLDKLLEDFEASLEK